MKASEHFDLPLEANQESVYQQDGVDEYLYEFSVAEFNTPEQAAIAAKCINHADKLADALADLILACYESGHNILACTYAEDALVAYRSEK